MPWASANAVARAGSRAATATSRVPVVFAGLRMARSVMRAAPRMPNRSGSIFRVLTCGSRVGAPSGHSLRRGRRRGAEQAADDVSADTHVVHGSLAAGFLGQDGVLFEGVPPLVTVATQGVHDGCDVHVPRAQRPVHASGDDFDA